MFVVIYMHSPSVLPSVLPHLYLVKTHLHTDIFLADSEIELAFFQIKNKGEKGQRLIQSLY